MATKDLNLPNATPKILELIAGLEQYAEAAKVRELAPTVTAKQILDALIADCTNWRYLWTEWEHEASEVEAEAEDMLENL